VPFDVGEAYYEYGMMLKKKGDTEGARAKFDKALAIFDKLGATTYIEKVKKARDKK
jgi:tetratricopeptide (TPR) repeat protein